jgi:predicted nucleic acid-binding protein
VRLLLDTNILLDVVLGRPGQPGSGAVMDLCEAGIHQAIVAWQTLPTVSYYYRRGRSNEETWELLAHLLTFVEVPTVGPAEVRKAWTYGLNDFEDALLVACAEAAGADVILTRNVTDFRQCPIPVHTPEGFSAAFPSPTP